MFHFYRAKIRILFTTLIFYAIKTFSVTSLIASVIISDVVVSFSTIMGIKSDVSF